jgi:hypothetical protein
MNAPSERIGCNYKQNIMRNASFLTLTGVNHHLCSFIFQVQLNLIETGIRFSLVVISIHRKFGIHSVHIHFHPLLQKGLFVIWGPTFLTSWSILKIPNKKWHFFIGQSSDFFLLWKCLLKGKFRKSVNPHIF